MEQQLRHENRRQFMRLQKNYENAVTNSQRMYESFRHVQNEWRNVHAERERIKERVRSAQFMSRNYLNALKNFGKIQKKYDVLLARTKNLEKKSQKAQSKTTKARWMIEYFTRGIPEFYYRYTRNRNQAARTIQKRILNRRAMRVLGTLGTVVPSGVREKIARSVLRTRTPVVTTGGTIRVVPVN